MSGQTIRALNIVDDCTRVCVAIEVDFSLPGERVARVLDRLDYNQVRPHQSLGWIPPEVFEGNLPFGSALRASPPGRLPSPLPIWP